MFPFSSFVLSNNNEVYSWVEATSTVLGVMINQESKVDGDVTVPAGLITVFRDA